MSRVFLSYAREDRSHAQRLREALAEAGINVLEDTWELPGRHDWAAMVEQAIKTSDVVVLLLSPSATSSWTGDEFELASSRDLDQRGADLIPVMTAPTEISSGFHARSWIDLTENFESGVETLVKQIKTASKVDFARLNPQRFENLVADLLRAVDFDVDDRLHQPDGGVDLRATFQRTDPFGLPETEVWLVQAKLYAHQRVSVKAIQNLASLVALAPSRTRGLLVTNTKLTSVAHDYITELERRPDVRLRVIDGGQLKQLLRRFPDVTSRYFGENTEVPA
ncbi:TIR domain-containing protein [Amycolatopsis sp. cmx-4-83]|uniref:TIR domain-containing protein n=1 Tax=Amycolatopsis sp. cmx-4-83 TaxID=2790940 RepID=UPI00397C5621